MNSTCPKCGKPLAAGRPKCFHCGAALAVTTPCGGCGRPLAANAARCVFCGAGGAKGPPPPAKAPPKSVVLVPTPEQRREQQLAGFAELARIGVAAAAAHVEARAGATARTIDPEAKRHFDRADALDDEGRSMEALAEYDRALAIDPSYAAAWSDKGHVLFGLGRFAEALEHQERAVSLAPDLFSAWSDRAACLIALGRPAEGLVAATCATELAPRHPATWINRAECERALGRTDDAIRSLERAAEATVDPAARQNILSRIASLRGPTARSLDEWLAEGARLGAAGDLDASMRALDAALMIDPSSWAAWQNKAVTSAKAGFLLDALAYVEHAVALAPPGSTAPQDLHRRVQEVLAATPAAERRGRPLPPGRFGATMVARAKSPDGAFAVHGLDACAARGLFAGPKDLLAVNYHLLVPDAVRAGAARETMVDALARSGTAFVFRHASAGFVPDGALAAAEIAALEALVAHGKLARVVLGGSVPWSATTTRAVQAADDRLARRLGAGERFTLLVLGTAPPD